MGEAGPEAIMPLRRNSAGELGVVAGASNQNSKPQMNVVVNNNHSGAQVETRQNNDGSFEIIIDQVEARMAARLARGQGAMSTATRAVGSGRQLRG
jgi:phage-related minor tail protein